MTKQPKPWVESMLVAYVDNQLEPAQMAAVEEVIREDAEARTIVAVLRRSAAAVKTAYDRPMGEPVPARLLAAAGAANDQASGGTVVPFARKLRPNRTAITALAASLAALAIGFGAGSWQAAPAGRIILAGDGTETGQYEAALYQALEGSNPGVEVAYTDPADGRQGAVTVVGPVAAGVSSDCLEFRHLWSNAGRKIMSRGLACRSDAGEWSVMSMPPKPAS